MKFIHTKRRSGLFASFRSLSVPLWIGLFCATGVSGTAVAASGFQACGKASWYKLTSRTASGERGDPAQMTAAHRTLPFGTLVDVTNLSNGRKVTVRINDRGPYTGGRVIDVTRAAARQLGFEGKGVTRVQITPRGRTIPIANCK